jgi:hypothetical protein
MKKKKNLSTLTVLEAEKEIKKLRGETEELIDQLGQEDEKKAAPLVREYMSEIQKKEEDENNLDIEQLKHLSNNKLTYQRFLIGILNRFLAEETIPKHYPLYVESNDQGIVLGIEKTEYLGAFKVVGIPQYDIAACKTLAVKMGNTIAHLEGYRKQTEAGIVIPDEIDLTKYGKRRPN